MNAAWKAPWLEAYLFKEGDKWSCVTALSIRCKVLSAAAGQLFPLKRRCRRRLISVTAVIPRIKSTVTAADLEYVPTPYNDSYEDVKLVPAWSLTLQYDAAEACQGEKNDGKTDSYKKIMFINAVTGEEIR